MNILSSFGFLVLLIAASAQADSLTRLKTDQATALQTICTAFGDPYPSWDCSKTFETNGNYGPCSGLWDGLNCSEPVAPSNEADLTQFFLVPTTFMSGSIADAWASFTALKAVSFTVPAGGLSGPFPSSLCKATSLTSLNFDSVSFTGPLPDCLGDLTSLTNLGFTNISTLRGSIPATVTKLASLREAYFTFTSLTGSVDVSGLPNLEIIFLYSSCFSGTLKLAQDLADYRCSVGLTGLCNDKLCGDVPGGSCQTPRAECLQYEPAPSPLPPPPAVPSPSPSAVVSTTTSTPPPPPSTTTSSPPSTTSAPPSTTSAPPSTTSAPPPSTTSAPPPTTSTGTPPPTTTSAPPSTTSAQAPSPASTGSTPSSTGPAPVKGLASAARVSAFALMIIAFPLLM